MSGRRPRLLKWRNEESSDVGTARLPATYRGPPWQISVPRNPLIQDHPERKISEATECGKSIMGTDYSYEPKGRAPVHTQTYFVFNDFLYIKRAFVKRTLNLTQFDVLLFPTPAVLENLSQPSQSCCNNNNCKLNGKQRYRSYSYWAFLMEKRMTYW